MRLSLFIYTGLLVFMQTAAYGQKDATDTLPEPVPGSRPKSDELYFGALKAKMHDDPKKADSLFTQFVALNPNAAAGYYELSKLAYNDKKLDEAEQNIKKAIALQPDNKWYKEQYATILAEQDNYAEAAKIMAELSKSEQDDRTYPLMAAEYYERARKYQEAINYLDLVIQRDGPDEDIVMRKIQLYLSLNEVDKAAGAVKMLITQDPQNGKYYKLLGELYDNNKMPEAASKLYDSAKKALPGDPYIELGLAEHSLKLKDTVTYIANVKKAIVNTDLDADSQLDLLKTFLQTMPNDSVARAEGLPVIWQVVAQHPNDAQALAYYGELLDIGNQRDSAVIAYKRSLKINPGNFNVWESLLRCYTDPKDADSLIKYSDRAIHLFPSQALVHYYNGIGYLNKKDYPAAIKSMNRAIDMQPENNRQILASMYRILADLYHMNKQDDLSDKSYDKSLFYDPMDAGTLNNYAYYLSERGVRLDDAERMSAKSLELRSGEATFLDTYSWIEYKKGDYSKALEYELKAIQSSGPDADATLYDHLGDIYYKLDNKDKAVQNWKLAKQKGSDNLLLDKKIREEKLYE